ncbi:MAG: hypothetical protein KIPDCIKN_00859 [Haliscomenobacter sp.]|nr:hypothetical protein [Haliscomenobacter sp.]
MKSLEINKKIEPHGDNCFSLAQLFIDGLMFFKMKMS